MSLLAAHLCKEYPHRRNRQVSTIAVADVSFELTEGSTIGVVGESGSGKSTLGRLALGIESPTSGSISLDGVATSSLKRDGWRRFRHAVQPIFQDPRSALNWRHSVETIVSEPLVNDGCSRAERSRRVAELLEQVSLPSAVLGRRPRELSGGMLQRVAIARALALGPRFLVCDEVLSALDMSVQAGVINLLLRLQHEQALAMVFISHDLDIVRHVSDQVLVMYRGEVVEAGLPDDVYDRPQHPYTRYLLGWEQSMDQVKREVSSHGSA